MEHISLWTGVDANSFIPRHYDLDNEAEAFEVDFLVTGVESTLYAFLEAKQPSPALEAFARCAITVLERYSTNCDGGIVSCDTVEALVGIEDKCRLRTCSLSLSLSLSHPHASLSLSHTRGCNAKDSVVASHNTNDGEYFL